MSSKEQLRTGKVWVIETFKRLANEYHVQIEELEWNDGSDDFYQYSLASKVGNKRRVEKFSHEKLTDCANEKNKGVRAELESRVRHIIRSLSAPKKKAGS